MAWSASATAARSGNRDAQIGKFITLIGTAQNAKLGAAIVVEGEAIYLKGKDSWKPEILGQKVRVKGLFQEFSAPVAGQKNGEWSAGVSQDSRIYRLENFKWEPVH